MRDAPRTVRILPMIDEFESGSTIEASQSWFIDELAHRENGRFLCHRRLRTAAGSLVLFQFKNHVIAKAFFVGSDRFQRPQEGYEACMYFNVKSIRVFEPIDARAMRGIWPNEFKRFSHAMQELDLERYPRFRAKLKKARAPRLTPTAPLPSDPPKPPERIRARVNKILRDTALARRVKMCHEFKCQICGHTICLPHGQRYAESHHLQHLGRPHNGHDVSRNIICVCPNHHAELDYGVLRLVPELLQSAGGHTCGPEYIDYHNHFIFRSRKRPSKK